MAFATVFGLPLLGKFSGSSSSSLSSIGVVAACFPSSCRDRAALSANVGHCQRLSRRVQLCYCIADPSDCGQHCVFLTFA
mmetsp:Transcript_44667/g.113104  ORF Transcript_44667/g.113104 Transcript_44667/m.113104 type:complete len:80 (-) Transcript_44667:12-251(-)